MKTAENLQYQLQCKYQLRKVCGCFIGQACSHDVNVNLKIMLVT